MKEIVSERNTIIEYKYSLGMLDSSELIEVGILLLENGFDDDCICILAGLNNEPLDEVLKYYKIVLSKLDIVFNDKIEKSQLEIFGMLCVKQFIDDKMSK